jgi:hypothetical protein
MGWISVLKDRFLKSNTFFGYSSKDLQEILRHVFPSYDEEDSLRELDKSMDLRLISLLKELITCLDNKNESVLFIYEDEIKGLLSMSHIVDRAPKISNIIHVPNWIVVLFVPFNQVPLYINLPSDLYKSLVSWRLQRGK